MLIFLLFIILAILCSFILSKVMLNGPVLKWITIVISLLTVMILLTPISFVGVTADIITLYLFVITWLIKLYKRKHASWKMLVQSYAVLLVLLVLLIIQAFLGLADGKYLISYAEIKKVTRNDNYYFIHRVTNASFVYPGNHSITVNKIIHWLPVFEYRIGKVDLGKYQDYTNPPMNVYKVDESGQKLIVHSTFLSDPDRVILIH